MFPNEEFDVAVLGAGVFGSCAAYNLAEAGKSTVLLDQFPVPHTRGSSGGQSRIGTFADYNTAKMAPIVHNGLKQWLKISALVAEDLMCLPVPKVSISTNKDILKEKAKFVENACLRPIFLSSEELNARYKTQFPENFSGLMDISGMVLYAAKCVKAVQTLFRHKGGVIMDTWTVTEIIPGDSLVTITGPKGTIRAKSLVLCPGPWAPKVLSSLGIDLPLRPICVGFFYMRVKDEIRRETMNIQTDSGEYMSLIPPFEYPGLAKFTLHEAKDVCPDERDTVDISSQKEKLSQFLKTYFPEIQPHPSIQETCMYTTTPDKDFIIDRHPEYRNIAYAVGCNGVSFQVAPAIGEMLCRMILEKEPVHDLGPFRASRFQQNEESKITLDGKL